MFKLIQLLVLTLALVGCGSNMPNPNTTGPVKTLGGGFINHSGKLQYGMTYKAVSQTIPLYATVEFENPESKSTPMLVNLGELSLSKDIVVQSPPFDAIRNNTNYSVILYIYSDPNMTKLIQKHSDQVRFSVPREIANQLGVQVL